MVVEGLKMPGGVTVNHMAYMDIYKLRKAVSVMF